jgi:addiction module RelE/StbE family toxin
MDVYKVDITEPAENDLREIATYISSQLNAPLAALNIIRELRKKISDLETNALIYPLVRDERLAAIGYRQLFVKNYTVFYIVNEKDKSVDIDRLLYSRRDWRNLL